MQLRKLGTTKVREIGLGCMNLCHAYGEKPSEKDAIHLLHAAYDEGVQHFDTATLYGFGASEALLAKAFKGRLNKIHLASKCGLLGVDGKRVLDARPESLARQIDASLNRLQADCIDLYYLHRWQKDIPIEESVGALSRMVEQGKVRDIGLSEVSAATLSKAHAIHPISAVQTEYSLWTRNVEIAVLQECRKLDIALVAFSPLGRGMFSNAVLRAGDLVTGDLRKNMPRFLEPNFSINLQLMRQFTDAATEYGVSTTHVALRWLLDKYQNLIPIPGTRSVEHLRHNILAASTEVAPEVMEIAENLFARNNVAGARYADAVQCEIDTEEF